MADTGDSRSSYDEWIGSDLYDSAGSKIGSIDQIYLDDRSGRPEWFTVSTGWFGTSTQFVPIAGTARHEGGLAVPYTTDQIKDAPAVDGDDHLDADAERRLYGHYGLDYDAVDHESAFGDRERADEGDDHADASTGSGGAEVTLSEEQLAVDKRERGAGSVRLRKYVVTEDVNVTVPVEKQVARIVRTPADGTTSGTITDGDVVEEVTLREEEVVVDKNVVAKENVAIETGTVVEEQEVSGTVRREEVEIDGDVDGGTRN